MTKSTRCLIVFFLFLFFSYIPVSNNRSTSILLPMASAQDFDDEDFDDEEEGLEEEDFDEEESLDDEPSLDVQAQQKSKSKKEVDEDEDLALEEEDFGDEDFSDDDFEDFGDNEDFAGEEDSSDGFDAFDDEDALAIDESNIEPNEPITSGVEVTPVVPLDGETQEQNSFIVVESGRADNYDREYENRLFQIYEDFYNFPVSESEWKSLTGDRKSEVYEIQSGDTLWDISTTFFGDGHYWPKIWSVNGRITNPHIIGIGNSILFNLGDLNSPPSFSVTGDDAVVDDVAAPDGESIDEGEAPLADNLNSGSETSVDNNLPPGQTDNIGFGNNLVASNESVKIPDTRLKVKPVLNNLPGSLPSWGYYNSSSLNSFEVEKRSRESIPPFQVPFTHFVRDKKVPHFGTMIEAEAGETFATTGQYLYVELNEGANGSTYLVANYQGLLKKKFDEKFVNGPFGHVYEIQGIIQIREPIVSGDKKTTKGKKLYRAYVETAYHPIKVGGVLIEEEPRRIEVSNSQDFNFTPAQITGGSGSDESRVLNEGMFAYINKGSLAGFVEGDKVMIVSERKIRREKTILPSRLYKVGEGQVVDVSDKVATLLVTRAHREIMVGDYLGEPLLGRGSSSKKNLSDDENVIDESIDSESSSEEESDFDIAQPDPEVSSDDEDFGGPDLDDESGDIDFEEEDDFSEGDVDGF